MCQSPDNTENMTARVLWMHNDVWVEVDVLANVSGGTTSTAIERIVSEWRDLRVPRFSVAQKTRNHVK